MLSVSKRQPDGILRSLKTGTWILGVLAISLTLSGCGGPPGASGIKAPGMRSGSLPIASTLTPGAAPIAMPMAPLHPTQPELATTPAPTGLPGQTPSAPTNLVPPPAEGQPEKSGTTNAPAIPGMPNLADGKIPGLFPTLDKIESDGNTVSLATVLLAGSINPFMSRLPLPPAKPVEVKAAAPVEAAGPELPPVDPFAGVNIVGIVYNSAHPMALISDSSGSHTVSPGDIFSGGAGTFQVRNISADSVELALKSGSKPETRRLSIISLFGYKKADSPAVAKSAETPEGMVPVSLSEPPSESHKTPPGMIPDPGETTLDNIKKLFSPQPPGH